MFDEPTKRERLAELDHLSSQPGFWDDAAVAQEKLQERGKIKDVLSRVDAVATRLDDAEVLLEFAVEDPDALGEAESTVEAAEVVLAKMEFQRMLGGTHDKANCFVEINAGAGGTESQDWASMILRMLSRFAESRDFKVELANLQPGEEAGIKSATLRIEGEYAFGYLKAENGVHRLVRISPFDSQKRRHTSFSSVAVLPEVDDDIDIEVNEGDVEMQTFRASGAGGQHVNKTNSAVRLTHKPSGVVVECQAERSQHKNRATAMKLLKSRLYEAELAKRTEERDAMYAGKAKIDFGSQIRSYVLQPYQMVKDLRTGHETSNTQGVLDGDLDGFVEAFLLMSAGGGEAEETA
ncbi:MAG: peptide chain release factor 2 [Myxococcales bacterium]|nr:peptide chain release factor 2 [Myxococcales bacterium]